MSDQLKVNDQAEESSKETETPRLTLPPLPNYTLSTVCPMCGAPTIRRACKVRCERCNFMWDCGEL